MASTQASSLPPALTIGPFLNPLNVLLLTLATFTFYIRLRGPAPPELHPPPPPVLFKTFTPAKLINYNGANNSPVYLAIRGRVFDVTPGRNFYGPGGPYENFAGRDATRGLAKGSFDEEMLTKDLEAPLDNLEGLDKDDYEGLEGWEETFGGKYLVVGKLVPHGSPEVAEAEKKGALA